MKQYGIEEGATRGRPIDFLGFQFTHERVLLRKSMKKKFARKMAKVKNPERRHEIMASYKGWCMQGDCLHLWQKLTGMKSFKELGIKANDISKDGKRYFDVPSVTLMDILNQPVEVRDFVAGVDTKNGGGRYAVLVNFNGEERKFITNNFKMKDILDQCQDSNLFPFTTTIRRRSVAGPKADYYFD